MTRDTLLSASYGQLSWCLILLLTAPLVAFGQNEEANKALARRFYEEVWFFRNPTAVDELVAANYVVHDIGDRKGVREPADEQKLTAERFWENGAISGHIDFQIAEDDLVATRWQWEYRPQTWLMKLAMLGGRNPVPIINVFRFQDAKIVEIWNHRHDIDVGFAANVLRVQGFGAGVVATVIVALSFRIARRRRPRLVPDSTGQPNTPLQPTSGESVTPSTDRECRSRLSGESLGGVGGYATVVSERICV